MVRQILFGIISRWIHNSVEEDDKIKLPNVKTKFSAF